MNPIIQDPRQTQQPTPNFIRISVITVVRNGVGAIRNCLASVHWQTMVAEHIVVDGQSTDGTLRILTEAQAAYPRLRIISEPDQGIYDALSKGIQRAQGDVIGCLNADDFYAGPKVLERVAGVLSDPAVDSCYGDLDYVGAQICNGHTVRLEQTNGRFHLPDEQLIRRWPAGPMPPRGFHWGWMPPHPTFFVRRRVYERYGFFRLDLGTSADYELMLRFLVKHRISTRYIPELLVKMSLGGVSNCSIRNRLAANWNDRRAWRVNGLRPYPWTLLFKPIRKLKQWAA
jgi:glycosyltransferase involved in cell wall biosynthesis